MKVDFAKLDRAFNPKCVAVVGDKNELRWLRSQESFNGKLYSVQVNPNTVKQIEALGVKNYASLLDIPEPIDLAIVAVPRAVAPRILEDCIHKEVAAAHFYTSGFSETGTEEGRRQEKLLADMARVANFHLIGPNCLGIFSPKAGIKQGLDQYTGPGGPVGFVSQSGNIAVFLSVEAHLEGVDINKSVSFGNGIVLESSDYLEYFAQDPDVKVIGMYIEGVKDGRRFLRVLKEVTAKKPVVIWKGGRTEGGGRAIASHTGSLAVSQAIWDAAVKQCGAVKVSTAEELIDTLKALIFLPPVKGNRVGIAGGSGGQSVTIADIFTEADMMVPVLTNESYEQFTSFFKVVGASYRNPIDPGGANRAELRRLVDILEQDRNVDNLALLVNTRNLTPEWAEHLINLLLDLKARTLKPLIAVLILSFSTVDVERSSAIIQRLQAGGVPTFLNYERGARALHNALEYYRLRTLVDIV